MSAAQERAADKLVWYFRTIAEAAGIDWTGDNDTEVRSIAADLVQASQGGGRP